MTQPLVLELPTELQQKLLEIANRHNLSLENLVLQLIAKTVSLKSKDEAEQLFLWLKTLTAERTDSGKDISQNPLLRVPPTLTHNPLFEEVLGYMEEYRRQLDLENVGDECDKVLGIYNK